MPRQETVYSIRSSARLSMDGGTVRPSTFAVFSACEPRSRRAIAVLYFYLRALMACVPFGLSSCAGGSGPEAGLSKPAIECQAGPDCDAKWARAKEWVEKSGLKILSKSDAQIKTKDAPNYDNPLLVVTITKNATTKPGIYEIRFVGGCTSTLSCKPPIAETRAGFAAFVNP